MKISEISAGDASGFESSYSPPGGRVGGSQWNEGRSGLHVIQAAEIAGEA